VSENWPKVKLEEVCERITDGTHHSPTNLSTGEYRYVTAKNIRPWGLDLTDISYVDEKTHREIYSRCPVEQGDVLYIKDGVTTGLAVVNPLAEPFSMLSSVALLKPRRDVLEPLYLKHWLNSPATVSQMTSEMTGTAIKRLVLRQIRAAPIPLPSIEQQRLISAKLNALLAKTDVCCERLDRIPQILKRLREAVLEAAVSGSLTEEWRKQNPGTTAWAASRDQTPPELPGGYERLSKQAFHVVRVDHPAHSLPDTWTVCTIADLYRSKALFDFADGNHGSMYPLKEEFGTRGAIFLTAQQINEEHKVNLAACPRLRSEKANQLTKGWAHDGDLLLTHNATVGRVALLEGAGEPVLLGTSVTFYRFNAGYVDPRFARAVFLSRFFQSQLASVMEQTTRNQVPITKQVSLHFVCPPISEQREAARRVDELFALADSLQLRYQEAAVAAEKLAPSVLAKAFRGELVPQDPNDEPTGKMSERTRESGALS
jgi:type I restriction enzyme, S subunit